MVDSFFERCEWLKLSAKPSSTWKNNSATKHNSTETHGKKWKVSMIGFPYQRRQLYGSRKILFSISIFNHYFWENFEPFEPWSNSLHVRNVEKIDGSKCKPWLHNSFSLKVLRTIVATILVPWVTSELEIETWKGNLVEPETLFTYESKVYLLLPKLC